VRRSPVLPILIFVTTGALGLGYQVLWNSDLLDLVGISAWSQAAVLCAFMGGLAVGSALLGPLADRVARPLLLFAVLEALVGLYAFVYGPLSRAASAWYLGVAERSGAEGGEAMLGLKLAVAAALLIPPTVLMGGSYPAMFRHLTPIVARAGRWSSGLYAANAFGAAAGALLMAFWMLPSLGIAGSLRTLGTLNVAAGLAAAALALWQPAVGRAAEPPSPAEASAPPWRIRAALVLLLLEGIGGFGLEIAWMRYFSVVLGSSVYSFAIVVAVFIAGMAIGSLALAALDRRVENPMAWFGSTQLVLGAVLVLPLPLYPFVPWLFAHLASLWSETTTAFYLYEASKAAVCVLVMLPATVVSGAALPLVVKAVSLESRRLGSSSGRAWAWDTVGNVLGAALAGTLLLPAVGMETLLRLCALWCGLVGFLALWFFTDREPARRSRVLAATSVGVLAIAVAGWAPPRWRPEWFTLAPFMREEAVAGLSDTGQALRQAREVILFHDDPAAHLMVTRRQDGSMALWTNGKLEASSRRDMPTQLLLAHVPLLLKPGATDVLVIGLASGVTCGGVLRHPVRSVDAVDVVRAMPEATRLFAVANREALDDPRMRVVIDDARSYVATTSRRYDVVVSEPSNVWVAGVSSLFTAEHYRQASRVLRPGGVYVQWVQAYFLSDPSLATLVRTFVEAFPETRIFQGNDDDLLLVGSREPIRPDWATTTAALARPGVRGDLASFAVHDVAGFLWLEMMSPTGSRLFAATSPEVNSRDNQRVSHQAPMDMFQRRKPELPVRLDERYHASSNLLLADYLAGQPGAGDPASLRALFDDPRTLWEPLATEARRAFLMATGGPPGTFGWTSRLLTDGELADEISGAQARAAHARVDELLTTYGSGILMRARLDHAVGRDWLARSAGWTTPAARALRVDLMLALGDRAAAHGAIGRWLAHRAPPRPDWALVRACGGRDPAFCSSVMARYLAIGASPQIERFRALQAAAEAQ
jgi:spermidine synthase